MLKKNNKNKDKIVLNEKILNFLCNECGLHEEKKDWWLKTIGNDFPINELENIDGDFKEYISTLKNIIDRIEFDRKGNIKTYTSLNGISKTFEYDKNNNMIKMKFPNGNWKTFEYDENNNMIKMKYSNGVNFTYEYDKNNNMTSMKNSNGYYETYEYDKNNNKIKEKNSNGLNCTYEYDKNNNMIIMKHSRGYYETYDYDKNNNMISYKGSNVDETYKYNITSKRIDIEFFSKGKLQDKCSIPITYRKKDIDSSINASKKEKQGVKDFSFPSLY